MAEGILAGLAGHPQGDPEISPELSRAMPEKPGHHAPFDSISSPCASSTPTHPHPTNGGATSTYAQREHPPRESPSPPRSPLPKQPEVQHFVVGQHA